MSERPEKTLDEYIKTFDHACGEEKNTVVVFHPHKALEAFEKIYNGMAIEKEIGKVMVIGRKGRAKMTLYKNGKLLLKGVTELEARELLEALLLQTMG